jgi:tetratricopeptide (TPR) repeat protein
VPCHRSSALSAFLCLALTLTLGVLSSVATAAPKSQAPRQPAAPASPGEAADAKTYDQCMELARRDPQSGFETGSAWRDQGGGSPAKHCVAVALINLKQYGEGATRLEQLATEMGNGPANLRGDVLDQAGQAWNLAGEPQRAQAALTRALALEPGNTDILIDRSIVLAGIKRYQEAIDDLTVAIDHDRGRPEAYIYRAAAYRLVDKLHPAEEDAERAVALGPDLPEAWLERGNVRRQLKKDAGARADWMKVLELAPTAPAADAARTNLEKLDVKAGPATP